MAYIFLRPNAVTGNDVQLMSDGLFDSVSESASAGDSCSATVTKSAAISEGASASDSSNEVDTLLASITENAVATMSADGVVIPDPPDPPSEYVGSGALAGGGEDLPPLKRNSQYVRQEDAVEAIDYEEDDEEAILVAVNAFLRGLN